MVASAGRMDPDGYDALPPGLSGSLTLRQPTF